MAVAAVFLLFGFAACAEPIATGRLTGFETEAGYAYELYVPSTYDGGDEVPLFVVLHGGTQTALDIASLTRMNAKAEQYGFIVLYPEQSAEANPELYWNWFLAANQVRGSGEPEILAGMIRTVADAYEIDRDAIFAVGFSAGACMALSLAILYPDLVAGVAMAGGLGFAVATDALYAYIAMAGTLPDWSFTVAAACDAMPAAFRHPLKALLFHGAADARVDVVNADYAAGQIARLNDLTDDGFENGSFASTPQVLNVEGPEGDEFYTVSSYADLHDAVLIREYVIAGMEHRWPGGAATEPFGAPAAPDMTAILCDFFLPGS